MFGFGVKIMVLDADQQQRTPRDVRGRWVRPRPPSKAQGRKGSRRRWKRLNAPHFLWHCREPADVLQYVDPITKAPTIIATPRQAHALKAATERRA